MPAEDMEPTPRRGERSRSRTQRAVDNDEEERKRAVSRETRRKKKNVRAQHAANSLAVVEEEESEGDSTPPPPPTNKPTKSTKSSGAGKPRISVSPAPAKKPSKPSQDSRTTTTADGEAARLTLVAKIAARDRRTDHINFTIGDLRLIWVNGDRLRNQEKSSDGKRLFNSSNLKDLGTMDAPDHNSRVSLGKGKPANKKTPSTKASHTTSGDATAKTTTSKQSTSRVSSTSTRARSISPAATSQRSSSVASKRKTSGSRPTSKLARASARTTSDDDGSDESDSDDSRDDGEDLDEIGDTEGEEANRKGKPKMSDYSGDVVDILDATVEGVGAHLLAHGWFLESRDYDCLILKTWRKKAANIVSKPRKRPLTIRKMRLIKYRVTSYQGRLKDAIKAAGLIQYYKLHTGTADQIKARVKKLTSNNQFHTKPDMPKGTGVYQDKFVQMAINGALFTSKKKKAPIAIKYEDKFRRMPLPTIAFICALTQFLIDAQAHGESTEETIVRKKITENYENHLESLKNIRIVDPDTVRKMQERLFEGGVSFSKVKPATSKSQDRNGGAISIADIVRAQPTSEVGRTTPPAELCASEDEDEADDKAGGDEPSDSDQPDVVGESRARSTTTESPVQARPSTKVGRTAPPAESTVSGDESDEASGGEPSNSNRPKVTGESQARTTTKPPQPAVNPSPKHPPSTLRTTPARSPVGPSPKRALVPVVSLPKRPKPKPKMIPAVVETPAKESEDGESSADDGDAPRKKTGNDSDGAGEGRCKPKLPPKVVTKGEISDNDAAGETSDARAPGTKEQGSWNGSAKRISPRKRAGKAGNEGQSSPSKKRQAESEERELFVEGSSKESKRRKRIAQ